jgi:hypothetical protein
VQNKFCTERGKPQGKTPRPPPTVAPGVPCSARSSRSSLLAAPARTCRCLRSDPIAVLHDSPGSGDTLMQWAERTGAPRCSNSGPVAAAPVPRCPRLSGLHGEPSSRQYPRPLERPILNLIHTAPVLLSCFLADAPRRTGPVLSLRGGCRSRTPTNRYTICRGRWEGS